MIDTTRWYPISEQTCAEAGIDPEWLGRIRQAGLAVCSPRKECPVHPGQPAACYLCL